MLFQTWEFFGFFLAVLAFFAALRSTRFRLPVLLLASYVFYAWWDLRFPIFLVIVTTADYFFGRGIAASRSPRAKKLMIFGSCLVSLSLLCSFKYLGFLTENLQALLKLCHLAWRVPKFDWLLPVGLSFFTFKSLSYTCDVYFGKLRCEKNFLRYAAYVSFFPQLVAGPIERAGSLLPQLRHKMPLSAGDLSAGFSIFFAGLFKKAVLADMLALYVDRVYEDPSAEGGAALLAAAVAYSWQIYFDFAGYSDMARGVARMMGFRTILNFNNPYVSVDVRDFWRRWHISLSTWFRDYLYIPLGGSRVIKVRVWFNLMVTMLVSGLWHGAAWTFIVWGGLNGLGSLVSAEFDKKDWYLKIPKIIKQIVVIAFITLTWVFFRSSNFADAFAVLKGIFTWREGDGDFVFPLIPAVLVGVVWIYQLIWASRFRPILESRAARIAAFAAMAVLFLFLGSGANSQFIYQQF